MNIQDVIKIGHMVQTGEYLSTKIVSLSGVLVNNPSHFKITEGTSISTLLNNENIDTNYRIVMGSIFNGRTAKNDDFIGTEEYSAVILSEELKQDMFSFMKPGFNKYTLSNTYMSFLLPNRKLKADASLFGEDRSCISCGICPDVCPVDIYPQELMKNILANERANYLELGLLDCVDCGLCTYVCPSKIELADIIEDAKNKLYKELTA
jgi:Na+-transporting NADH:ubiquinone oxidoreductase subunit A